MEFISNGICVTEETFPIVSFNILYNCLKYFRFFCLTTLYLSTRNSPTPKIKLLLFEYKKQMFSFKNYLKNKLLQKYIPHCEINSKINTESKWVIKIWKYAVRPPYIYNTIKLMFEISRFIWQEINKEKRLD